MDGFVGAIPEPMVKEFIDKILPTEADHEAQEALEEELQGDLDDAEEPIRLVTASFYADFGQEQL